MEASETVAPTPGEGVRFLLTEDQQKLVAKFKSPENLIPIDREWVTATLAELSLDHLFLSRDAIDGFIQKYNAREDIGAIVIGERRDAEIILTVSADKMRCHVTLFPSYGGTKIDLAIFRKLLKDKNVIHGLKRKPIEQLLAKGEGEDVLIAEGQPPIEGVSTQFDVLLEEVKDRTPAVKSDDSVDYRDLGEIVAIPAGTELMRRTPAKQGVPGTNVHGQTINPKPVTDLPFSPGLDGAEISASDPNLLLSTTVGQAVFTENGISIENVVQLPKVDMSSGNIKFDGSVEVLGDVAKGMKIDVTGDVVVRGIVEASQISAGGDVLIANSIIGSGDVRNPKGKLLDDAAIIRAGGAVSFRVGEYVYVETKDCIYIDELAMHCELHADNEIVVGNKTAKRGQIVGGLAQSGFMIQALQLGNQTGVKTIAEIRCTPGVKGELQKLDEEIGKLEDKQYRVKRVLLAFKRNPKSMDKSVVLQHIAMKKELDAETAILMKKKAECEAEIERVRNGQIQVKRTTCAGTHLIIGRAEKSFSEDQKGVNYRLYEDKHIVAF
jgi:uncharacterized protein (DUF342 family)